MANKVALISNDTLDVGLQIKIYETQVQMESIPGDPFDYLDGVYTTDSTMQVPEALYLRLSAQADKGRTTVVPFVRALEGNIGSNLATYGNEQQVGQEENIDTLNFTMNYNDVSHAVAGQEYGILARDKFPYKLFEKITPLLGTFFKELIGLWRRQALLEIFDEHLGVAPVSLTPSVATIPLFNPNFFFASVAIGTQPSYQTLGADWTEAVGDGTDAMTAGAAGQANLKELLILEDFAAATKYIDPIEIAGKQRYVLFLPSRQARLLKDPSVSNSASAVWRDVAHLTKEEFFYPNVIGSIGRLLVCEDPRWPTLTRGGADGSWTITAKYKLPGRGTGNDPRDFATTGYSVGFLCGKAALCEWRPEDFHFEIETENYDKIYGKGMFAAMGVQMPIFNTSDGSPDHTTLKQDSSIAVVFNNA